MPPHSTGPDRAAGSDARAAADAARRYRTETRIVAAATELFLRDGYAATTLAAVATKAGVSERTVYVRFKGKVELFQRVIEVGIVGDVDDLPMPQRQWSLDALSAPTAAERIHAFADGVAEMHERLGPLMAVNGEVEGSEPAVQVSAGRWRDATHAYLTQFWAALQRDELIDADADLDWLIDTTTILTAAESRLLISRTLGWDRETFRAWIVETFHRIIGLQSTS